MSDLNPLPSPSIWWWEAQLSDLDIMPQYGTAQARCADSCEVQGKQQEFLPNRLPSLRVLTFSFRSPPWAHEEGTLLN